MKLKSNRREIYLDVCHLLRQKLHAWSDKDGRLPSEQEMSDRFGVNRRTLRKALAELRSEGHLNLIGRHYFVTFRDEDKFIGILMDSYKAAPFIYPSALAGAMLEMEKIALKGRILVPGDEASVVSMVQRYNLCGLLWFDPPKNSWPTIAEMGSDHNLKIASVIISHKMDAMDPLKNNYVLMDQKTIGKKSANYFLDQGHHKIAFLGQKSNTYQSFVEEFKKHGVDFPPRCFFEKPSQVAEKLPKLIANRKINGVFSGGGALANSLFEVLSGIENLKEYDLDIQVPYNIEICRLMKDNPHVRVSAFTILPGREYGSEGVRMLRRLIEEGRNQEPVSLPSEVIKAEKLDLSLKFEV